MKAVRQSWGVDNNPPYTDTYILIRKKPVRCYDYDEWERWMIEEENRQCVIAYQDFSHGVSVFTRFTGFNIARPGVRGPILFETIVYGGTMDRLWQSYRTWKDAEVGHAFACVQVRESLH